MSRGGVCIWGRCCFARAYSGTGRDDVLVFLHMVPTLPERLGVVFLIWSCSKSSGYIIEESTQPQYPDLQHAAECRWCTGTGMEVYDTHMGQGPPALRLGVRMVFNS